MTGQIFRNKKGQLSHAVWKDNCNVFKSVTLNTTGTICSVTSGLTCKTFAQTGTSTPHAFILYTQCISKNTQYHSHVVSQQSVCRDYFDSTQAGCVLKHFACVVCCYKF